ncbi:hypothetical protein BTN49_1831 [Candidatus Enterovibrio escicola]|uniref:Uncharacterized protein n=1 Tax=Candidatus Enterovibrio escicola TaxID=1927127 RepID=A0A2A5T355_9GAMM|nr:hypothetical protein BTN49_1831 [Candidatus Enterovibrio escacola]
MGQFGHWPGVSVIPCCYFGNFPSGITAHVVGIIRTVAFLFQYLVNDLLN